MKKILLLLLTLSAGALGAMADNTVSVSSALIPQGKSGTFCIELTNSDSFASSMEVHLTLPEGITFGSVALSDRFTDNPTLNSTTNGQNVIITTLSATNAAISGNSGPLLFVTISADAGLAVGAKLTASVSKMELAKKVGNGHEKWNPEPFNFEIEITDKVILDEDSPALPIATNEAVDILVKRTIKANLWSTICLPFDMTKEQLINAFGDNVQLALFDSYIENGDGSITVNFEDSNLEDGLAGNYPYIIKTSKDISEFEVDAKITPDEENAIAEYQIGKKPKLETIGTFTGTLHAGTVIPENYLFLSNNKFYFSLGSTKCKAFRAYFWFKNVVPANFASSRIILNVSEGSGSYIHEIINDRMDNYTYDLQGRRVEKPVKGLYIHNGRKEVVR
jgi:hypothetical protein